ncbi:MAG: hypothetical protein ACKVZ6_09375 [Kineosporiaceae bacterium]
MTQHVVRPEVASFVAQVRSYLSDLTPEEVEELSGGLEADLDERLADSMPGAPRADLGDPASYAAELRAAAGLPPRGAGGGRRGDGPGFVRATWASFADAVRRRPWWPQTRESVVSLRPAWWLVRAWVVYQVVSAVVLGGGWWLPPGFGSLVLLLLFCAVSVALGRGLLDARLGTDRRPWVPGLVTALNVLAVLLLPVAVSVAGSARDAETFYEQSPPVPGLAVDGSPVRNIFAYDARGTLIPLVQLYDQDGRPLAIGYQEGADELGTRTFSDPDGAAVAPWVDDRGQGRWNVFPVPGATYPVLGYDDAGNPMATAAPSASVPPAPIVAVPPITGVLGVPSSGGLVPGASTSPTPAPASPTPTATGPASATRTP